MLCVSNCTDMALAPQLSLPGSISDVFKRQGFLVTSENVDNLHFRELLDYTCRCGAEHCQMDVLSCLRQANRCKKCYKNCKTWDAATVKLMFEMRGFIIEEEITTVKPGSRVQYTCKCGTTNCFIRISCCWQGHNACRRCWVEKRAQTVMKRHGTSCTLIKRASERREKGLLERKCAGRRETAKRRLIEIRAACDQVEESAQKKRVLQQLDELIEVRGEVIPLSTPSSQQTTREDGVDESKSQHAETNGSHGVLLWPHPCPKKENYPHLLAKEFSSLYMKWYYSCPLTKARCAINATKKLELYKNYGKSDHGRQKRANYKKRVKDAVMELRKRLAVDGCCSARNEGGRCTVPLEFCHIHHTSPNEMWTDGKTRKQETFGEINGLPAVQREIARNTDSDGNLLLALLCPKHHFALTFTGTKKQKTSVFARSQHVAQRKVNLRICQYEKCETNDDACDRVEVACLFHLDHVYAKNDPTTPVGMEKLDCVGTMVRKPLQYNIEDIDREIDKCQLMHAVCHFKRTQEQFAAGTLQPKMSGPAKIEELDESVHLDS